MNESYIISKMNEFMFQLSKKLSKWLDSRLPCIANNWWDDLVINNLSTLQRNQVIDNHITDLSGLDLAALLRVFDRNWFVITNKFFVNNRERNNIKSMMTVRNTWAHITSNEITKKHVLEDVEVIFSLLQAFDATSSETRDIETFQLNIQDEEWIIEEKPQNIDTDTSSDKSEQISENCDEIIVGSVVNLISDKDIIGAVIAVTGEKYTVLVNGVAQTFFAEQIELKKDVTIEERISLDKLLSGITAYQIQNPGNSNLYSLNAARIDFVPYQFRPALKMIKADTPRLLVADDVGVGKTIEAGLILKEMEARSSVSSVLIVCPRPLVAERKWELEMRRFDENFTQLDGVTFATCMEEMVRDHEWPDLHKKTVIPYSLFNEDSIMGTKSSSDKKKKTVGLDELDPLPHFDLVIVDEAHTIRNANTWAYRGVELFCRNADAVVFLTATPLQNSTDDLYTLLNLLRPDIVIDKDIFNTMAEPNAAVNALLRVVRGQAEGWQGEAKKEIGNILDTRWGRNVIQHNPAFEYVYEAVSKQSISRDEKVKLIGKIEELHSFNSLLTRTRRRDIEDFCIRRNFTKNVLFSSKQQEIYDALMDFESQALTLMHGSRSVRFMMCTIMRQAASCIFGLAPFLNDFVQKRMNQIEQDGEIYEFDFSLNDDEQNSIYELADEIDKLCERLPEEDPKFDEVYSIIESKQKEENNRVILFSSFRHTLSYVLEKLKRKGIRAEMVTGAVKDELRFEYRERFMKDRTAEDAIDVLLFSEVGCEGLDYQFCDTMINYDLPWNPMRIEQRIGRIDRRGQKSDTVRVYNIITDGTIDAAIYNRCLSKIGVFEASIGDCSEILGDITDQILKIMFDPKLTQDERMEKLEQMADNEVMKVQEMRKLEDEEKSLYGFDLSTYIQNKDVQNAENEWISPNSICKLVTDYLNDFLGEGSYIQGKDEKKTLRLSVEKKALLLDALKGIDLPKNNAAYKAWRAYLKATDAQRQFAQITFDYKYAKDNRDVIFLTQMHPLVIQAAQYESRVLPNEIGISISSDDIPTGEYTFMIYAWRYVGLKPDIQLIAVSDNEAVQECILSVLQYAKECGINPKKYADIWDKIDTLHYTKWKHDKDKYKFEVKEECDYRKEQQSISMKRREIILRQQIEEATDDRIRRMRTSQLEKLSNDFAEQKKSIEETIQKADIHTNLLLKGVLKVY